MAQKHLACAQTAVASRKRLPEEAAPRPSSEIGPLLLRCQTRGEGGGPCEGFLGDGRRWHAGGKPR